MDFEKIKAAAQAYQADMTRFLRDMIAIPSESCEEKGVAHRIAEEMKKLGYSQDRVLGMLGKAVLMGNHSAAVAEGLAKSLTVNINGKPVSLLSQPGIAKGIEALKDKEIKRAWQAESRSHTREEWARQRAVRNAMSAGTAYGSQNDDLTRETVVDKLHLCTDETYPEFVRNARAAAQGRYLKPENQIDLGRLKYGIITGTEANLYAAAAGEHHEYTEMYPSFANIADSEGFSEVACVMRNIAIAEQYHEERFLAFAKNIKEGRVFVRETPVVWRCRNCGCLVTGTHAPALCPACAHPTAHFEVLHNPW